MSFHSVRRPGLVLSGGGARGAFQVGVWRYLRTHPLFVDKPMVISGTSAGALNGAFIAAGKTPDEMLEFWLELTRDPPYTVSHRFTTTAVAKLVKLFLSEPARWLRYGKDDAIALWTRLRNHAPFGPGALPAMVIEHLLAARFDIVNKLLRAIDEPFLGNISRLRKRLVAMFGGEVVPTGAHRLAINTVDVHTGEVVRFCNARPTTHSGKTYRVVDAITVDMVMASAAIPLLFNPVRVGQQLLWDGGLLVNTPLAAAVALGAEAICSVLVTQGPDRGRVDTFGKAVERVVDTFLENSYNLDRKLLLERNRLASNYGMPYRKVELYKEIRPGRAQVFSAGSYLFFRRDKLREMHVQGELAVREWIAEGAELDVLSTAA